DVLERDGIIAHRPGDGAVGVAGHSAAVGAERERGGKKVGLANRLLTRRLAHRLVGAAPQHSDAEQRYDERGKGEAPEEFFADGFQKRSSSGPTFFRAGAVSGRSLPLSNGDVS